MAGPTLMYFSVGYCQYCKAFTPVWSRTVALLDAYRVPVRAQQIACDQDRSIAQAYGVKQFPTILLDDGQGRVHKYMGERRAQDLLNWTRSLI